jgi:glycosyltransferase involved in cell wall biosynthesis
MRVAFDFTSGAWQKAGIGRATRGLIQGIMELDCMLDLRPFYSGVRQSSIADEMFAAAPYRLRRIPLSERLVLAAWHRFRLPCPVEMFTGRVDLVHSPDFVLPPSLCSKSIVTIHDLSYVTHPETSHPAQKRYLDKVVPRSVEKANRIIAVSAATRDDLVREYGVDPGRVEVIHNGLDRIFSRMPTRAQCDSVRRLYDLPDRFVLAVGTIQPRKNLRRMIRAVSAVRKRGDDVHLVHAGAPGWLSEDVLEEMEGLEYVRVLGPVDDMCMPPLYAEAEMTMAASLTEGFMFPVIESMAMGTPVITSNVSSMPEVAGEAAIHVDPLDIEGMAEAIWNIIDNPDVAHRLVRDGIRRAKEFEWTAAAEATLGAYRRALAL